MKTSVINARLIGPTEERPGVSIGIEDGVVAWVEPGSRPWGDEVIDAGGRPVLPGLIDSHTHFGAFLPFEDDLVSETQAAAAAGVTTVFHVLLEQGSVADRLDYYVEAVQRLATVDMHFWAACMTQQHLEEIPRCRERGIRGFKFFMAYKGDEMRRIGIAGIDLDYLYRGMEQVARNDAMAVVHAENYELLQLFRRRHSHENTFSAFCRSRPPICEDVDVYTACRLAEDTGAALYVVHVGAAGVVDIARSFRERGNTVHLETSPRYLVIDHDGGTLARPELALTTPSYKSADHQEHLWAAVAAGDFDILATDSAANKLATKLGDGDVWKAQPGWQEMPTFLPMLWTEGVAKGRLTPSRLVTLTSHNPARIFGLAPQKGAIEPGADADLVIIDPDTPRRVDAKDSPSACDFTPYEDWELSGWPVLTMARGRVVFRDGVVDGSARAGRVVGLT